MHQILKIKNQRRFEKLWLSEKVGIKCVGNFAVLATMDDTSKGGLT